MKAKAHKHGADAKKEPMAHEKHMEPKGHAKKSTAHKAKKHHKK